MKDVIDAWNGITRAWDHYRATLREALANDVQQAEIARALNRTREMIRRDAMTPEQRDALRRAESERKANARAGKRAARAGR